MKYAGQAQRFGDDINTDYIIAAHRKMESLDLDVLARYTFEDIDPGFVTRVRPGDIAVAGRNFGCGSSRETAVHVLKRCGISAVVAQSFARIFFRNAINNGLPLVECDTSAVAGGDWVELDLDAGLVRLAPGAPVQSVPPLPSVMQAVLEEGGLVPYLRKHGDLVIPS